MDTKVRHAKVLSLPPNPAPNTVYYVLDTITVPTEYRIKVFITDMNGFPIPILDLSGGGDGNVVSVTGTAVTGTATNPIINIASFISSQLNNRVQLSSEDGKLFVKPVISLDDSISVSETSNGTNIQLSNALATLIESALQASDLNGYATQIWVQNQGYLTYYTEADPIFQAWLSTNPFSGYVQFTDLAEVATTGDYNDLLNLPVIPTPVTHTSDIVNDGETGDSRFVEEDELSPVATSGNYNDLNNKPLTFPPSSHTHTIGEVVNLQSELDAKFDNPSGNSGEYLDGTGTPTTFPTIPAAQVNSDWNAVSGVAQILNKPATFPPSTHNHTIAHVTGLQTALDNKQELQSQSALSYSANVTLDFAHADEIRTILLTGDVVFTDPINRTAGKEKVVIITADSSTRALSFPSSWVWTSTIPTTVAATKRGVLYLYCFGTTTSDILATYAPQTN